MKWSSSTSQVSDLNVQLNSTLAEDQHLLHQESQQTQMIESSSIGQAHAVPSTSRLRARSCATPLHAGCEFMPRSQSTLLPSPCSAGCKLVATFLPFRAQISQPPDASNPFGGTPPQIRRLSHCHFSDVTCQMGEDTKRKIEAEKLEFEAWRSVSSFRNVKDELSQ